ncbi:hypothetical protein BDQ12DRAFT_672587 [Crucibulum laeve]|uniref:GDP-fucose protein O-fucosyltransferase-domain-containing protein n=1 Tax=Crucibulum laeve TaxID=68775 RepID=A0A5C3MSA7_9AGAR|nr:hypothetical protein BDQ12DRAFT_672587 [Crucibulum laeve]
MLKCLNIRWNLLRSLLLFISCLLLLAFYSYLKARPSYALYDNLTRQEREESLALIHNSRGNEKYVYFKQLQGAGFNNQAQEILLFHHLALITSRIYVYQPLVWRPRGEKSHVPLSAFLSGPTKSTISSAVFNEVCPESEIYRVNLRVNYISQWERAVSVLSGNERCIVVTDWIFNWGYLATPGIHTIWPSYQKYLANHFEWSDSVLSIVDRSQTKLRLHSNVHKDGEPYIAIHLRRGDFEGHCESLASDHIGFTTWATLPVLQLSVLLPALDTSNATSITAHCYPSLYRILDAISHQARLHPNVRTLHVLHDGAWDHPLVYLQYYKLAEALKNDAWAKREGWPNGPMVRITQSADVPIGWGEADWAVCVDVELGRRAEAFIGNGYSSLSTQISALRLGDGGRPEDITFV